MEANEMRPWTGNQRGESLHKLQGFHHDMGGPVVVGAFELQHPLMVLLFLKVTGVGSSKEVHMETKLIQLADGTLVEVEVSEGQAQPLSGGYAEKISASFDNMRPILLTICRRLSATLEEINKEMLIEQAELEIGLSFEAEGNLYITKSKAGANLSLKLVLKPDR